MSPAKYLPRVSSCEVESFSPAPQKLKTRRRRSVCRRPTTTPQPKSKKKNKQLPPWQPPIQPAGYRIDGADVVGAHCINYYPIESYLLKDIINHDNPTALLSHPCGAVIAAASASPHTCSSNTVSYQPSTLPAAAAANSICRCCCCWVSLLNI